MAPTTVLTVVQTAISIAQLFGPKGYSLGDLMRIQTEMLKNISNQLLVIQRGIEEILKQLDEIHKLLEQQPERVSSEIYRRRLEGIIRLYKEIMSGFIIERDTNGIISAHRIYDTRIEDEILKPLRDVRNTIFTFYDPIHIPFIGISLQVETHSLIITSNPNSVLISTLSSYKEWLEEILSDTVSRGIPLRIKVLRETYNQIVVKGNELHIPELCFNELRDEGAPDSGCLLATYTYTEYFFKTMATLSQEELELLKPLLDAMFITEKDFPRKFIPDVGLYKDQAITAGCIWTPFSYPEPILTSTHPNIVPGERPSEMQSRINRTRNCSIIPTLNENNASKKLSSQLETTGYSIITLASLSLAATQAVKSIEKYLTEIIASDRSFLAFRNDNLFRIFENEMATDNEKEIKFPSLKLSEEVDLASIALDLAELPLSVQIFQLASLAFRNAVLEEKANAEFKILQTRIFETISNPNIGYLLEVEIYTDEFGQIVLPSGQLLFPIGAGVDAIDAYSEHLRIPQIRQGGISVGGLKNNTFFLWIRVFGDNFIAQTIPKDFRKLLIDNSLNEAKRRNLLSGWKQSLPLDPFQSIALSKYWIDVEQKRLSLIQEEERKTKIKELSKQMRILENRTNVLYQQYQEVQASLARQQKYYDALSTISTLAGIIKSGIEVHELVCSSNNSEVGGNELNSPINAGSAIEFTSNAVIINGQMRHEIQKSLKINFENLKNLEVILKKEYESGGIPLPEKNIFIPPPLQ